MFVKFTKEIVRFWAIILLAGSTLAGSTLGCSKNSQVSQAGEPADSRSAQESVSSSGTQDLKDRIKSIPKATPVTVQQALEIYDARRFPIIDGYAAEDYSTSVHADYNVNHDFDETLAATKKTIDEYGWREINRDDSVENRMIYQVTDERLFYLFRIVGEENHSSRVTVTILGNFDMRLLPKAAERMVRFQKLDYLMYESQLKMDEVVEFYHAEFRKNGWQNFEPFDVSWAPVKNRRMLRFRNNAISLMVSAEQKKDCCEVLMLCEMFETDIPTPSDAIELELDDHLFRQRCKSKHSVDELVEFFGSEMRKSGWIMYEGRKFENTQAGMFFTNRDHDPVYVELIQQDDGTTSVYVASPPRQVSSAVDSEPYFEVDYKSSLPLSKTQMHSVHYQSIPFNQDLEEGSGRTIAESVFFNTNESMETQFEFYSAFFEELGWSAGTRKNNFIGESLTNASVTFTKEDATIVVSARPWVKESIRISIEGNGIQFPGTAFCHMMARDDSEEVEWSMIAETILDDVTVEDNDEGEMESAGLSEAGPGETTEAEHLIASSEFPIPESAKGLERSDDLEMISYDANSVRPGVEFFRNELTKRGWKESEDSFNDDEYASLMFHKSELEIQVSLATDDRRSPPVRVIVMGNGIRWAED